jgi:hypothetical protein
MRNVKGQYGNWGVIGNSGVTGEELLERKVDYKAKIKKVDIEKGVKNYKVIKGQQ